MTDREKVIKGLERCKLYNKVNCDKCPYDYNGRGDGKSECTAELASDVLALLKEQKKQKFIVESDGEITPFPDVVRCKDCDNRECDGRAGTVVCGITGDSHGRLWFCGDGERAKKS